MDAELMNDYNDMAELVEEWYGIKKKCSVAEFCEYGHKKIFEDPMRLGLSEEQAEDFKGMYNVVRFMQEHGGRIKI